jgi:hypothetical protein
MDDVFDKQTAIIRRQQQRCEHTCFVCPKCRLYKDNIKDEEMKEIRRLEAIIEEEERLLTEHGIYFVHKDRPSKDDRIELSPTSDYTVTIETIEIDTTP